MEPQPNQVNRPWDSDIKIGDRPSVPIPAATSILQIFDQPDIAGKLLILGAPGSGKTTTMLDLANALVEKAEQQPNYPIPVLLNLSTWKDNNQSMQDWLAAELKSKYGVRKDIGKAWVENRQLLPLLDGLDELEVVRQESCAKAINQLLESDARPPDLVVCSRLEEYNTYPTNLQLHGAICLRELDNPQIQAYLTAAQQPQLWHLFQDDPTLLELVRKPLLLSISVLSGQELAAEQWHTLSSTQDRLQHLLDAYVRRMMARKLKTTTYGKCQPPHPDKTRRWLTILAQQLKCESQTEFLIEEMQSTW
ncbi:MAG: NACHT domain-containing protein, partial [Leptolyngbyaceae cyanobacterium CAN_BIN12]|nr:NACHT domain-containing protein [Leptolyngbyaceae cyanobacterium CAN_BIN12]